MLVTVCILENLECRSEGGRVLVKSGLPEHDIDDQRVAHQAADTDQGVEYLYDCHHVGGQPPTSSIVGEVALAVTLQL